MESCISPSTMNLTWCVPGGNWSIAVGTLVSGLETKCRQYQAIFDYVHVTQNGKIRNLAENEGDDHDALASNDIPHTHV